MAFVPWTFSGREVEDLVEDLGAVECSKLNELLWELGNSIDIMLIWKGGLSSSRGKLEHPLETVRTLCVIYLNLESLEVNLVLY